MMRSNNKHFLNNAVNKGLFQASCLAVGKAVGQVPLAGDSVAFICDRAFQKKRYIELYPVVMESIKRNVQ